MDWEEYAESLHPVKIVMRENASVMLPLDEMTPDAEIELSDGAGDDDE